MMDHEFKKLVVNVPESSVGEVMGELNRRGAWLDNMTSKGGFCIVETRVPKQEIQKTGVRSQFLLIYPRVNKNKF